jgi:hypothetical protein
MLDRTRHVKRFPAVRYSRDVDGRRPCPRPGRVPPRDSRWKEGPVTVCIAAMCEDAVITASDWMLTFGTTNFEPPMSKLFRFTPSIGTMSAGDSALIAEIGRGVWRDIGAEPGLVWTVQGVAELYQRHYGSVRRKKIEADILAPFNLTVDEFLARQHELNPAWVQSISEKMSAVRLDELETIICGMDQDGPHIYQFLNGAVSCHDTIGFATIGAGYWHASSQLLLAGQFPATPIEATVLFVYLAKKRAESVSGVGSHTDMFVFGRKHSGSVTPYIMSALAKEYQAIVKGERRQMSKAVKKMHSLMAEAIAALQATGDLSTEP